MHYPGLDLPYGTVPGAPRSDGKTSFWFSSRQEMLQKSPKYHVEVESRTQGSGPRPGHKKIRGLGQECSRPGSRTKETCASVIQKKRSLYNFSGVIQKKGLQNFFRRSTKFQQFKKYYYPRTEDRAIFEDLRL